MELVFAPKDILQIDDARITFRNFSGKGGMYNREGDRNFALVIPTEEMAEELTKNGWNVKIKPPREDGEEPFMFMTVKVAFTEFGPNAFLHSGKAVRRLDEDSISCLDRIDIETIDMDIRPHDWVLQKGTKNEKRGRSAYLREIHVFQRLDRFAEKYGDMAGDDTVEY